METTINTEQPAGEGPDMLGYATVPRAGAGRRPEELSAQVQAIRLECRRRELVLVDVVREPEPDHDEALQRPGLGYALRRIADGEARGLVVAELSAISRSVTDLGKLLEWFSRSRARLVSATPGIDTGEQGGQLAARALIDVSSWARERSSRVPDRAQVSERIARMRADGMTLQAIADRLNEEGVPTIGDGGEWQPVSVQAAVGYWCTPVGVPSGAAAECRGQIGGNGG